MRLITATLLLAAALLSLGAGAAEPHSTETGVTPPTSPLQPFKAEYTATYNGMPIVMVRALSRTASGFAASTHASNFLGSIREDESFRLDANDNLLPDHYRYQRAILGKSREEESRFGDHSRKVTGTYKDRAVTLAQPTPLLAPLSYQIQMQLDSQRGHKEFRYDVATRGKIKNYHYKLVRQEKITTPLGTLESLVLERQRADDQRKTLVWLAPKLQFLPVKLIQEEDGEHYEMSIKSYVATEH